MIHFGEPGELSLYDATNGWQYLGFVSRLDINEKAKTHKTIDRALRRYDTEIKVSAVAVRGDAATVDALRAREGTAQSIYFCGLNSWGRIDNALIIVEPKRRDGINPKLHTLAISAVVNDPANVVRVYNLFNGDGTFDVDSNSDGLADGWSQSGLVNKSLEASFLSGRGNAQRIETTNAAGQLYYDVNCPFNDLRHFTFSVNIKADDPTLTLGTHYFRLQIEFRTATGTIATISQSFSMSDGTQARKSISASYSPTQQVTVVRASVLYDTPDAARLVLDDAQLEINKTLTAYNDK